MLIVTDKWMELILFAHDSDGDGIVDSKDLDSDNDGIYDIVEGGDQFRHKQ